MRRITAVIVGVLAVAGLALTAGTAFAADGSTNPPDQGHRAPVAIHLTCSEANASITCTWDPYDGAASYRVAEVYRHGHRGAVQVKTTTATTLTVDAKRPGHYHFVVRAVDAQGKVLARSNRANVTVKKAAPAPSTPAPAPAA